MAVSTGTMTNGLSGGVNKEVVFRQREGKTIVSAYPDMSKVVRTEKQKKVNEMMRAANYYAQVITGNEEERMKAQFRLDVPSKKVFTALIKEYFEQNSVKSQSEREKKTKKFNYESYRAVIAHLLKTGRSPEEISKIANAELNAVLLIKKELEEANDVK